MNLEYVSGDLLAADIPAIAHGCNQKGVMGAGIARLIKELYPPSMYLAYEYKCFHQRVLPGEFHIWPDRNHPTLYNLITQIDTGADADLRFVRRSIMRMVVDAEERGIDEIGLPRIGCGIGGLKWDDVEEILQKIQQLTTVQLVIYTL